MNDKSVDSEDSDNSDKNDGIGDNNFNNNLINEILSDNYKKSNEKEEAKNNECEKFNYVISNNSNNINEKTISNNEIKLIEENKNNENNENNKNNENNENNENNKNNENNENTDIIIDNKIYENNININEQLDIENNNKINIIKNNTNNDKYNGFDFEEIENFNNPDMHIQRLTVRNNNNKYLITLNENNKISENINVNNNIDSSDDEEENKTENENLFPFRILGDVKKKGKKLGFYHHGYLEIDSFKQIIRRYNSNEDYPQNPKEIIPIKNLKLIKKIKSKEGYDIEITFRKIKKNNKQKEVKQKYRFRNFVCRNEWFDSLFFLWKHAAKDLPTPNITKKILLFIDDRIGIVQNIKQKNKNISKNPKIKLKDFKILNLLGVGGFGTVFKVKHILTDKIYAMKVMNKNYVIKKKYLHYVVSEFKIMKSLSGFPFVLDLHYCFQSANYLYLIIDYCPGGDFTKLNYINNAKLFFAEVILAFEHIHKHNIIYRDLKPENILLDTEGHIKICDFNLAKSGISKEDRALSFCGSPMYLSPEMINKKGVNYKCDIYGIGLLMYEIVTKIPAYTANDLNSLYNKIKNNNINFRISGLHGDIKDLLEKILVMDPEDRPTLEKIKEHPYFRDINFNKVMNKEYGPIIIEKIKKKSKNKEVKENKEDIKDKNIKNKEEEEYIKFKLEQKKLDEDEKFTVLDGKVSLKEMINDSKRIMKNYVREFYFIKKEDIELTQEFQLNTGDNLIGKELVSKKDIE